jgi:hypothetical protein
MAEELGARAAGLLVDEAWAVHREGRYQAAAGRAAEAAASGSPTLRSRRLAAGIQVHDSPGQHTPRGHLPCGRPSADSRPSSSRGTGTMTRYGEGS